MLIRQTFLYLVLLSGLVLLGDSSNPAWSQSNPPLKLDAKQIPWAQLTFQAKGVWVDVTAKLYLESVSTDKIRTALIESNQGTALPVPDTGGYKFTSDTIIDSIFQPPVTIVDQVWFDPGNATALGRMRLRQGEDDFKKTYRFTQQGVFRHRREPKNQQEAQLPPANWTDVRDTFYPYDPAQLGCAVVSERLLLAYIISAIGQIEDDKPLSLCVFGKRQLFEAQLKSAGLHAVKINYNEKKHQSEHRRQGNLKARKIMLETRPLESNLEKVENFSFLGFHKNITFFIDPALNLPVQVSGEIPKAGKATLKLLEVQLK
jgi:hypothetical protein